jgi:hypothetical protein
LESKPLQLLFTLLYNLLLSVSDILILSDHGDKNTAHCSATL